MTAPSLTTISRLSWSNAGSTPTRAQQIISAHTGGFGLAPLTESGKPPLDWLLRKHVDNLSPYELRERIRRYYPQITEAEISAAIAIGSSLRLTRVSAG